MLSNQDSGSTMRTGMTIYRIGIGIQELFIIMFLVLTQRFHARMSELDRMGHLPRSYRWRMLTWAIYAVLALITMRIIFRLVEFSQGVSSSNPILNHEGYTYGLDALPMLLAAVLLNAIHPGLILKGPESEFPRLSRKEKKVIKLEKKEAKEMEKGEKRQAKTARKQRKHPRRQGDEQTLEAYDREDSLQHEDTVIRPLQVREV